MFGTALDVAARGDRFTAYVPARRAVLETGAARESLGLADPGPLGCLVWSAGWRPPAAAWSSAATEDSLVVLEWREAGELRRLGLGASGLPAWVEWTSAPSERLLRARYTGWRMWEGVWWPARVSVADGADTVELTARVDQIRFRDRIPTDQMTIDVPDDAERVTRDDLRELLERMAGL